MSADNQKKLAAEKAVESIQEGMVIGLGTGSTFQFALEAVSKKIKDGSLKNIVGVPTSEQTKNEAIRLGIPLTTLNELYRKYEVQSARDEEGSAKYEVQGARDESQFSIRQIKRGQVPNSQFVIDVTIDGADEVTVYNPEHDLSGEGSIIINLIKGGGGAMLREKVIAQNSRRNIIIIDESKLSEKLGEKFSVPVEVLQYSFEAEKKFLESLGADVTIRKNTDGKNFVTDEKNFILDANFGAIENVTELNNILNGRAGIVEHGLFVNVADEVIYGEKNSTQIKQIKRI